MTDWGHWANSTIGYINYTFIFVSYQLHFYLSFPLLFQSTMLLFSRLHDIWRRSRWPADHRATQGARAPTRSLPGGCLLVYRRILRRPVTRTGLTSVCREVFQGSPPRVVSSEKVSTVTFSSTFRKFVNVLLTPFTPSSGWAYCTSLVTSTSVESWLELQLGSNLVLFNGNWFSRTKWRTSM
jgi:hypothetical protein